jgi:hypothetical protein
VEKHQMEEIPKDTIPITMSPVQSYYHWKQAESAGIAETNSQISSG